MVSEGCSVFQPHLLKEQLQFDRPLTTTDDEMTFAKGHWLVRVAPAKVVYCEWDDADGTMRHGV